MAKANITQYSSTPSSNTDINNINIDENCPASGLNNAIRELMAHLKNVDTGSQALTALSVTGVGTFGSLDISGDIDVDGTTNLDNTDIDGNLDVTGTAKIEKSGQALNLDTPSASQNVWMNFSDNGSAKWEIQKNTANLLNIYSYDASSTVMSFDTAGHVTMPHQSAFHAHKSGTDGSNITASSEQTVTWSSERFDQNFDFSTGGNQFTAPVTGKYFLQANVRLENLDTGASFYIIKITTSNEKYQHIVDPNFSSDLAYYSMAISVVADMDANDTAQVILQQQGGNTQTFIDGDAEYTYFSGYLVA